MYILIILFSVSGYMNAAVATAEFNGLENCQNAAAQVQRTDPRYKAICAQRGR
jgi:hypothetical protein